MSKQFCPKCGSHWMAHNDDGSCVKEKPEFGNGDLVILRTTGEVVKVTHLGRRSLQYEVKAGWRDIALIAEVEPLEIRVAL